jgi:transcriptional regulator GlxA family with amidase domain
MPRSDRRLVAFVAYDGVQPLDVVGPHEVFAGANAALDAAGRSDRRYDLRVVGTTTAPVTTESGLRLAPAGTLRSIDASPIDTLVLPGGDGSRHAAADPVLRAWIARSAERSRRTVCVCTGTFLAAAAGLTDGRRVTTHWARAERLARAHPDTIVDPDPIYVRDGDLWTSAGVTAGIDLALALVEDDCGADIAQTVARWLVVFLRRPGGQTQFAAPVWTRAAEREPVRAAQDLIHADPGASLPVARLAAHAGLSPRHFTRVFTAEVGEAPARYVERIRVDAARRLLETERTGVAAVAAHCGFGTAETMRRAFVRQLGVAPDHYRRHFAVPA